MLRSIATVLLAFSVGMAVFPASASFAQESADGRRKIANKVVPLYPELARRIQMRGTVKLEALVASNGNVKSTQVIGGNPLLVKAAVDAIAKWKWVAAPQETKELIELNFHPE